MIKLYDALLTDGLPDIISKEPWALAMSTAVQNQIRELIDYADKTMLYASINSMSESVLDIMALDMHVPEYYENYTIGVKRALIKGALAYWSKAGTKAAIEDLCQDIFGDAIVEEWFEYSGLPGYFKVTTTNPNITSDNVEEFKSAVASIKRLSAWLDGIELILATDSMKQYYGFSISVADFVTLTQKV